MPGYSEISTFKQASNQTAITVGASSVASAAFASNTFAIRVASTTACFIKVGDGTPTATGNDALLPANWIEYILVNPGQKVAFLQQTAGGTATVTELTT